MQLIDSLKAFCVDTTQLLQGSARQLLMASTVKELGAGGSGVQNVNSAGAMSRSARAPMS
jgi:hypothetical protein